MKKEIIASIELIKERIEKIHKAKKDRDKNILPENYYYDSLKLSLIEIGEESKIINDYLKEKDGRWDDIISKEYHFRISLTHFYKNMNKIKIDNHLNTDFENFIKKINSLEKKYKLEEKVNKENKRDIN